MKTILILLAIFLTLALGIFSLQLENFPMTFYYLSLSLIFSIVLTVNDIKRKEL